MTLLGTGGVVGVASMCSHSVEVCLLEAHSKSFRLLTWPYILPEP